MAPLLLQIIFKLEGITECLQYSKSPFTYIKIYENRTRGFIKQKERSEGKCIFKKYTETQKVLKFLMICLVINEDIILEEKEKSALYISKKNCINITYSKYGVNLIRISSILLTDIKFLISLSTFHFKNLSSCRQMKTRYLA